MRLTSKVEALFHLLADLDADQRRQYFAEHPTDAETLRLIESLLANDAPFDADLDSLIQRQLDSAGLTAAEPAEQAIYGSYRLIRELGRGGMSEVWLAERIDGLVRRVVALKLPHGGVRGPHFADRLARERDILATLEHRGIARLYDAGLADGQRPFLALEYVEGVHLVEYCNQRGLTVKERLELFLQVFDAVQFAHSRLVIHRDLKPSNILVTAAGEVKLLDFGIAKIMIEGEAAETELTQFVGRALTLGFASPEQITGGAMTTASDVYSLGAILFEMLSGGKAFIVKRNTRGAIEEAILDAEPLRPSQSVTSDSQASERSTTVERLRRMLRGDLDVIVLKAMQKRPDARYSTVDAFRADVQRYLDGEAVLAQPESSLYRTRKFVRRHRGAFLTAATVVLVLVAGLSAAVWQARIAKKESRTAAAMEQFTEDIFRLNNRQNPDPLKAQQTTARQLLDMGARQVSSSLNDAPDAKLRMLAFLGSLYNDLDLSNEAVSLERERVALAKRVYGARSPQVVPALVDLGRNMHASRSVNEREAVLLEGKAILDENGDFQSKTRGFLLSALAENYTSSDIKKGAQLAKESVAVLRRYPPSPELVQALFTAGFALSTAAESAEAEVMLEESIRLSKQLFGDPNLDLPRYFASLGEAQLWQMRYSQAERSFREAYRYARLIGGENDVDTFMTESRLGTVLAQTSRPLEALPYLEHALAACLKAKGADDPFYTPQMEYQYGTALAAGGQLEDGLAHILKAIANRREHRPGTAYLAVMLLSEADILIDLGRLGEAETAVKEAKAIRKKVNETKVDAYVRAVTRLAMERGQFDEATAMIEQYTERAATTGPVPNRFFWELATRGEVALSKDDAGRAIELSQQMQKRLADAHLEEPLRIWMARALMLHGRGLELRGDVRAAVPIFERAIAMKTAMLHPSSPELGANEAVLGRAYMKLGDRERAHRTYQRASTDLQVHPELCASLRRDLEALKGDLAKR